MKTETDRPWNITVAGCGYVGLSLATLLAQRHHVRLVDIALKKVNLVNTRKSPVKDEWIEQFFAEKELDLNATINPREGYSGAELVLVAVPTDYDSQKGCFDTSAVEAVVKQVERYAPGAVVVIRSTVPVGFTQKLQEQSSCKNVLFSPEFLRESTAMYDSLYPSRIIVGTALEDPEQAAAAHAFAGLLSSCAGKADIPILIMSSAEAEAVKLFSNTYLAMRVAFFNELDTFSEYRGLDPRNVIEGMCLDSRIGPGYNNPSFGYGGYCLPKDTRQLLYDYGTIPEQLIHAIVKSNETRKSFIAEQVLKWAAARKHGSPGKSLVVGIYRLSMKSGSDNFRQSSVGDVMEHLAVWGTEVIIFEPILGDGTRYCGIRVVNDLEIFKRSCDVIVANRYDSCLDDVKGKVYTRDIFLRD